MVLKKWRAGFSAKTKIANQFSTDKIGDEGTVK